ncbi:hypothetical protein BJ170DRAFT_314214 [Xylariales sp. AK1849]|nr:hypothetical protein BJ170DRAFT_314214 [Xylariales sp. AK1849]
MWLDMLNCISGICSSAASTLVDLFEALWRRNELRCVNVFAVNALFTTLIQLSAEMRMKNPVLGANAMGKFDVAFEVLRSLSEFWLNAEIILRLFEDSSERLQQELHIGKNAVQAGHDPRYTPFADSAVSVQETSELPQWPHNGVPQVDAGLTLPSTSSEQLYWTSLYWENSGFDYMSPFEDFGLYQPT